MKTIHRVRIIVGLWLLGGSTLWGAVFDSGSDGTYGPLNITNDTVLDLPADGIFHCTTINIQNILTFNF